MKQTPMCLLGLIHSPTPHPHNSILASFPPTAGSSLVCFAMKLFCISSSSLNLGSHCFYQKIQTQFLCTIPTRTRLSRTLSVADSLYSRISPLGDPNVSVAPVLDQWVREGKRAYRGELRRAINELTTYRRFKHALEVSLWMTNKGHFAVDPFDVAVRLKLIFKNFGLEQVEKYFNKIPENLKTYHVYLGLLNCYTIAKTIDKAESTMQKARDLGYVSKPIWYNLMMNLHYQLGNREKLRDLLAEMEAKGISRDQFTYSICLSACGMVSDVSGMDKIVMIMESNPRVIVHWRTYVTAAEGYLRMGVIDKALGMLSKLEMKLKTSKEKTILFVFLLKLYAETGKKDELYRIWNLYKQNAKVVNKGYISMMRSLMKIGDIEGAEKLFEEWKSSGLSFDFRIPNFLIDAYCTSDCLEKAEAIITKGISRGGDPSVTTWCHLAGGYLKRNEVKKAVEALKKAISRCPPKYMSQKDSLSTCLEYLENGDCMEKAEELISLVRIGGISKEAVNGDFCGLIEDGVLQSCGQDQNAKEMFLIEDEQSMSRET